MKSSNQIVSELEYTKYLNLGLSIASVMLHVTTIFFTFHLIYCSKFDKKSTKLDRISNSFFMFLVSRGFGAVLATPYFVYLIAYWSAKGVRNYEPYALLLFGIGSTIHTFLPTLSALLLTLDRCFALTFPMRYNSPIAKRLPWLTLACYTSWSIFVTFYVLREIPLEIEKVQNCQFSPCVFVKYRCLVPQYVKLGMAGSNVIGSCYLMFAMKRNSEKLKNDVVKFTVTMDILLDAIPIFANSIFISITGFSPSVYIGQLVNFLAFLNVTVCSLYYSWRLTRRSNGFWIKICRVDQVTPITSST
ncbi:hypothetical protein DdX_14329 [Ditylenchus destructor]|uniref:Uncharacterized protein n=1 Tax=Ditylenchus destructor TaxID=166010 RepID=A0AAD4R211_9BILA|nr:hypothetical protein DdX_14329 [Ditylenchus destructor]